MAGVPSEELVQLSKQNERQTEEYRKLKKRIVDLEIIVGHHEPRLEEYRTSLPK